MRERFSAKKNTIFKSLIHGRGITFGSIQGGFNSYSKSSWTVIIDHSQRSTHTQKQNTSHRWNHFVTAFFYHFSIEWKHTQRTENIFVTNIFAFVFFRWIFDLDFIGYRKKTNYVERHCKECLSRNPMTRFGLHSKISIHRWLYLDNYLCGEPKNLG